MNAAAARLLQPCAQLFVALPFSPPNYWLFSFPSPCSFKEPLRTYFPESAPAPVSNAYRSPPRGLRAAYSTWLSTFAPRHSPVELRPPVPKLSCARPCAILGIRDPYPAPRARRVKVLLAADGAAPAQSATARAPLQGRSRLPIPLSSSRPAAARWGGSCVRTGHHW